MGYKHIYQKKLMTADEAVKNIKSGDWVDYAYGSSSPRVLDAALAKRMPELHDVNIRGALLLWKPEIFKIDSPSTHFTWNSWHMGSYERNAADEGFVYYSPMRFVEAPRYYRDMQRQVNVAMAQVTEMDNDGYFNFGINATYLQVMIERADLLFVEVNEKMPRCLGGPGERIHISKVAGIVEGENASIGELLTQRPSEIDCKVAEFIMNRIPNGACLQLGIGGMPNAVGQMIAESDLKDLGVHTEMYIDAFVDIAKAGKITGAKKSIGKLKQTYSFAAGTKKLYEYLDDNPECESRSIDYVNDVRIISRLDNFISINNAVEIDIYGQVSS